MWSDHRPWIDLLLMGFLLLAMLIVARPSGAEGSAPDLWETYWRTRMAEAQERQADALERQNNLWLLQQPAPRAPQRPHTAGPQVPDGATWCVGEGPLRKCY